MMNGIQIFNSPLFGEVRVGEYDRQPMFCLADICGALGLSSTHKVAERIDDEDRKLIPTPTPGGIQQMTYVSESGLYDVVIRSDAPSAKPFRRWVVAEVLPAIRKNGVYETLDPVETMIGNPDFAIRLLTNLKEEKAKRIELESDRDAMKSKALFADAVAASECSCLISELAKLLQQNSVNIGQNRLFEWLRENGYLCSRGEYHNQPTQRAMKMGLFEVKKTCITKPDGSVLVPSTTKVSGKGQIYFVNKFLSAGCAK